MKRPSGDQSTTTILWSSHLAELETRFCQRYNRPLSNQPQECSQALGLLVRGKRSNDGGISVGP
jgi:hypothetical protein